jgi:hypothetical protein
VVRVRGDVPPVGPEWDCELALSTGFGWSGLSSCFQHAWQFPRAQPARNANHAAQGQWRNPASNSLTNQIGTQEKEINSCACGCGFWLCQLLSLGISHIPAHRGPTSAELQYGCHDWYNYWSFLI